MTIVNFLVLVHTSLMVLLVRLLYPKTPISEEKVLMSSYRLPQSFFLSGLSKHFLILSCMRRPLKKIEASVLSEFRCFSIAWTDTL